MRDCREYVAFNSRFRSLHTVPVLIINTIAMSSNDLVARNNNQKYEQNLPVVNVKAEYRHDAVEGLRKPNKQ